MIQPPAPVEEYISPAPAGFLLPVPVVESCAPVPVVSQLPAPVDDFISPAPAVFDAPAQLEESISPAPAASAPVVEHFSPAPAVFRLGGLQGCVPGQSSTARRGDEEAVMPRVTLLLRKPLRYVFQAYCRRLGLQESQVLFSCDGFFSPDHSPDQLGHVDGDILVAEEVFEENEEEDEDMDEICGTGSRFPAGFLPMRMCWWFPSGNCRQGWGCMFADNVNERHPKLVLKFPDDFNAHPFVLDRLWFPRALCGGVRIVERLFVGLRRTCGQEVVALVVEHGRGTLMPGIVFSAFALCFLWSSAGPGCSASSCSAEDRIQSWFDSGYMFSFSVCAPCIRQSPVGCLFRRKSTEFGFSGR